MARELNARGEACGVNTVAKVMNEVGIRAKATRRFVDLTDISTLKGVFYDRARRHSTPEHMTPDEFERAHHPDIRELAVHFPWGRSQTELHALLAEQRESRLTAEGRARLGCLMGEHRRELLAKAKALNEAGRWGMLVAGGLISAKVE